MLRRRLSRLARMSLKVAHDCAHDRPSVRFVYASRHGELQRTTTMLAGLADAEELSPTAFGFSVLNASAGLFSIVRQDKAPATAVSAAAESFGYGLLEACLQLAEHPDQPVLLVYADEPVPEIYGFAGPADRDALAVGLLLEKDAGMSVQCAGKPGGGENSQESQAQAFLRCLLHAQDSAWHSGGRTWFWTRHDG